MSNQLSENLDNSQVSLYAHVYDKRVEFKNLFVGICFVVVEFRDHRQEPKCNGKRSKLKHNQTSLWDEILRLNEETGGLWTYEQAIQLESKLLLALHPQLDLDPNCDQATNDTYVKPTHRKLKKKKRKLNSYEVEVEDAKRVKLEKMLYMMDERTGKEFTPTYNQIKYFRSENAISENNQHVIVRATTSIPKPPLIRTIEFQRDYTDPIDNNDKCELENTADYETFVKSFVILHMMNNTLLDDSEQSNKLHANIIVQLAEEFSQESNQNELFNNADKREPYQLLELLDKQPASENKSSALEYTNDDGKKIEITSIFDLHTAAVMKRHATESSSMPPPPRPPQRRARPPSRLPQMPSSSEVAIQTLQQRLPQQSIRPPIAKPPQMVQGSTPMQITQNTQSIQLPQTRPPIQNRPIVQITSPQTSMQGMIQLSNQPMAVQATPNHVPINVQMPTQQAVQITSPMLIRQQPRQGIATTQVVQAPNSVKLQPNMVMSLQGMQPTMSPQSSRQPPNQNPAIVAARPTQIPAQNNSIKVQNQIQPVSQSAPGTPIQLTEQTQIRPVQRSPVTQMKSPAQPSRTSAPSTPMQTAEQVQITQPSQRSTPNTPISSPGQIQGHQSPQPSIVITSGTVANQHPIHNGIQLSSAQNNPQQNISAFNQRMLLQQLRAHHLRNNQIMNQATNPQMMPRRFTSQVQVGNSQQPVDVMLQQQIIGNNQGFVVQPQFSINQQMQGIIPEQTPQLQLNMSQMSQMAQLYRIRPSVVRQPVTQQQMTLNAQPFQNNNSQWVFQQRPYGS
ncbi:19357_t:CDS:2 [Dentiscutata erythropus]|uniref:19357_t:CDS:1 n=1 Tax=Dentiscutata erythropus TaxID=1348616 RepID=A0A9N8ZFP6_9GLOM|nr:19357_t:CDS:2 [Dentiscutata erythropus]